MLKYLKCFFVQDMRRKLKLLLMLSSIAKSSGKVKSANLFQVYLDENTITAANETVVDSKIQK